MTNNPLDSISHFYKRGDYKRGDDVYEFDN